MPGYSGSRQWDKYPEQTSVPQTLQGQSYYFIRALANEGGGGDNLGVAVTLRARRLFPCESRYGDKEAFSDVGNLYTKIFRPNTTTEGPNGDPRSHCRMAPSSLRSQSRVTYTPGQMRLQSKFSQATTRLAAVSPVVPRAPATGSGTTSRATLLMSF